MDDLTRRRIEGERDAAGLEIERIRSVSDALPRVAELAEGDERSGVARCLRALRAERTAACRVYADASEKLRAVEAAKGAEER